MRSCDNTEPAPIRFIEFAFSTRVQANESAKAGKMPDIRRWTGHGSDFHEPAF